MRLFLVRHAHAEQVVKGMSDYERRIDDLGKRQLEGLSNYLEKEYSGVVFQVLCSPATRAKSTLVAIQNSISITDTSYDHDLYLPNREQLLHNLWGIKQASEDVMIISHNNGISDLATYFLGETLLLPTCGLLVIEFDEIKNSVELSGGLGMEYDCYFK